jgi:hypothetical protein
MILYGVMTSCPIAGVVSVTAVASATQFAVAPAEVIPFHVLLVPTSCRARFRCGLAIPAFVNKISGESCKGNA